MARGIDVIQTASVSSTGGTTNITTPARTTRNNSFLVLGSSAFAQNAALGQISDSKGLTWNAAFTENGARGKIGCYYELGGTRGSGHTFTLTVPVADAMALGMVEFSGVQSNSVIDQNAHQTVGVSLGFPNELIRSGATGYTFAKNELLIGVAANSSGVAPFSTEAFIDRISLANGAVEDILMSYYVTKIKGTYNFNSSAGASGISAFRGSTFRVIQSVSAQGNAVSITTAAITTTTGSSLIGGVAVFNKTVSGTQISDSKANTWQSAFFQNIGSHIGLYYVLSCIGGAGHTFTFTPTASDFSAIGVFEVSGITSYEQSSSGSGGASGNITTTQDEELLIGLNSAGSGGPAQSTSQFTSLWTDDISLAQTGVGEGLVIAHRVVDNYGQFQFTARTNGNNAEGAGIATFVLPGPTQKAVQTDVVTVLEAGTAYATPARAINIEYLTVAAAILEGSMDLTTWVTLDTAPGAGMRFVSGVVAPYIRPSKDITVVFRKTKAKL